MAAPVRVVSDIFRGVSNASLSKRKVVLCDHGVAPSDRKNHWFCDQCHKDSKKEKSMRELRYRCEEGCNYDLCEACYQDDVLLKKGQRADEDAAAAEEVRTLLLEKQRRREAEEKQKSYEIEEEERRGREAQREAEVAKAKEKGVQVPAGPVTLALAEYPEQRLVAEATPSDGGGGADVGPHVHVAAAPSGDTPDPKAADGCGEGTLQAVGEEADLVAQLAPVSSHSHITLQDSKEVDVPELVFEEKHGSEGRVCFSRWCCGVQVTEPTEELVNNGRDRH
mmetsp:Transcript_119781/g.382329  ORF Transcript_119781/g.382329 Transcript_119781/m.382329 type:complete len:280 (+) Transcript_119781:198-1037(+)